MRIQIAAATLLLAFVLPASAAASPWLLRANEFVVQGRYDFQRATDEFLDEGEAQAFPLDGIYQASTFETTARLGILDDYELELSLPVKVVSYKADPVILLPAPEGSEGIDYYQENVLDLSRTRAGVGDVRLTGRFQIFRGRVASSFELSGKFPTGYDGPSGTFGDNPKDAEDFLANAGTFVSPENIEDDVTLGDGQLDIRGAFLFGVAFPTQTFLRLDAGYELRLAGAGDQVVGGLRMGQVLGKHVLVSVGAYGEKAIQDGDVIGVSVAAQDPNLPAEDYLGTENLALREVRLDRDSLTVSGGVIVRLTSNVEASLDYGRIVAGRNIAEVQTVSFSIGVRVPAPD